MARVRPDTLAKGYVIGNVSLIATEALKLREVRGQHWRGAEWVSGRDRRGGAEGWWAGR